MTANDSLLGQTLDDYRIDKLLGSGGMARVYRALDTRLQRYIALKVIAPHFRADKEYTKRFEREAKSIARLEHPNIVHVYRFGEASGLYYIAMEYVEGADVGWLIDDYRQNGELMPVQDVTRIVREIGSAVDFAHSKNVIHRDIKPTNIIVNNQGRAVLMDFGLALLSDAGTRGEIFGSPHYLSPEQAISSGNAVPQSDLYALGITLYEMLTGELPFTGDAPLDVVMRHLSETPAPPSQFNKAIPVTVDEVVLRVLEKDPMARYESGLAFSEALDQAVQQWGSGRGVVAGKRRPSLINIPAKVDERLAQLPLPPLPAGVPLPASDPKATTPGLSDTDVLTQKASPASRTLARTQRPPWVSPFMFGSAIFLVGLALIAVLLLPDRNNVGPIAALPTNTAIPLTPTNSMTATVTARLPPTPTALVLPTQMSVAALPTATSLPTNTAIPFTPTNSSTPIQAPTLTTTPTTVVLPTQVIPALPPTNVSVQSTMPPGTPLSAANVPTTAAPTTVPQAIPAFSSGRNWMAITNTSTRPLSLDQIKISRSDRTLTASDWNVTVLNPGICLRINKDDKTPTDLPPGCTTPIDYTGSKSERDGWFKADETISVTLFAGPETPLLSFRGDRHWVSLTNISGQSLALNGINLNRGGRAISFAGVTLQSGACWRFYKDAKPPTAFPPGCLTPVDYQGSKADRDAWFKDDNLMVVTFLPLS